MTDLFDGTAGLAPQHLLDGGIEAARGVLAMQGQALAAAEPFLRDWFDRRAQALAALRRLIDTCATARAPGEVWQAQQEFWTGETERLSADGGAVAALGLVALRLPGAGVTEAAA